MARDKIEKLWIGGGAVAALVVAGAVWTFAVSPEFADANSVRSQAADTQTQNLALQSNVTRLQQEYAGISRLRGSLTAAHEALPSDLAMSSFTQQIGAQAKASRVSVQTLTVGAPAVMTSAPPAASTTSGTATSAPTPTSTASTAPGIFTVPVTVAVAGKPADDLKFLRAVQLNGPRAALLTGATSTGSGAGTATLSLQLTVFVAPPPPAAPTSAGATPTADATPTASPSSGG